jgi:hypothetical protein
MRITLCIGRATGAPRFWSSKYIMHKKYRSSKKKSYYRPEASAPRKESPVASDTAGGMYLHQVTCVGWHPVLFATIPFDIAASTYLTLIAYN